MPHSTRAATIQPQYNSTSMITSSSFYFINVNLFVVTFFENIPDAAAQAPPIVSAQLLYFTQFTVIVPRRLSKKSKNENL
jgi:hypothetical protein